MSFDIAAAAAELDALQEPALVQLLQRRPSPLPTYLSIMHDVKKLNVASCHASDFCRRFNGFYGVRRNEGWRTDFYKVFEAAKSWTGTPVDHFEGALRRLHSAQGRVEASFCSKLVATLHPDSPIIDSIVTRFFRPFGLGRRAADLEGAVQFYRELDQAMRRLTDSPAAVRWADAFVAAFPDGSRAASVSATKRLDFLIWAGAR